MEEKKPSEDWFKAKWRPAIAWTYIAILMFDFILAPITRIWFAIYTGTDLHPWVSLTLAEGGLFHISIGAILGVSAWTRGQEKLKRLDYGYHFEDDAYDDYDNRRSDRRRRSRYQSYDPNDQSQTPPDDYEGGN